MRLLHIVSTLDPASGGPAEGVRLLMTLQEGRYTGEVVTLDSPDAPFLRALPFQVHALGPGRGTFSYAPHLYPWLRANRHRFDGVIVNGLWQYCGFATMLALRGSPVPYAVYAHGMLDTYFKRRFPLKHLKKVLYWYPAEYWVLRNAYRVLFTTETEAELAQKSFALWAWKPSIVPYGILPSPSSEEVDRAAFYERVPALRGQRFLVYLGRIHPKKGCDMLVRAFCKAAAQDAGLHLLMAGPDQVGWSGELKQIATGCNVAERIHWPGELRDAAKWGAFRASEAFILPSHQENFGIAVAEALACGIPVLLSDQVNIVSLLADYGCALVEPDTEEGTVRLMQRWIDTSAEERARMQAGAIRCYESRLNLEENVDAIVRLFQEAPRNQQRSQGKSS